MATGPTNKFLSSRLVLHDAPLTARPPDFCLSRPIRNSWFGLLRIYSAGKHDGNPSPTIPPSGFARDPLCRSRVKTRRWIPFQIDLQSTPVLSGYCILFSSRIVLSMHGSLSPLQMSFSLSNLSIYIFRHHPCAFTGAPFIGQRHCRAPSASGRSRLKGYQVPYCSYVYTLSASRVFVPSEKRVLLSRIGRRTSRRRSKRTTSCLAV